MVGWLDCQRGRHRGLAALLSSLVLQVAESPLTSLTLAAQRLGGGESHEISKEMYVRDGGWGWDEMIVFVWKVEGYLF